MDLQLHDGYSAAPRRVFTNTRQLLRSAYGTPTYFQFLNESGMDESYDDETLELGWEKYMEQLKTLQKQAAGATPKPKIGKQELITAGKQAAGQALQTITQPGGDKIGGVVDSSIQTGFGLIPGGNLLLTGISAMTGGKSVGDNIDQFTPEQAAAALPEAEKKLASASNTMVKITLQNVVNKLRAKAAQPTTLQPAPIVAALPTGFPMVGKTPIPVAPAPDQAKQTTFAGMDIKTLALLGIGGFLAYKFLTKK